jgi:hypothetical protein
MSNATEFFTVLPEFLYAERQIDRLETGECVGFQKLVNSSAQRKWHLDDMKIDT